jgi:hypothetical protein
MDCAGEDVGTPTYTARCGSVQTVNAFAASLSTRLQTHNARFAMLYTIAVVLLILWVLGLVTSYTVGGFIHILLVVAVVMILVNLITGRRAL